MEKVGSRENALWILDNHRDLHACRAAGWEQVGEGYTRMAFLGPDGVVYKVCHGGKAEPNAREHKNATRFRRRPLEGWYIPVTTLYSFPNRRNVLAMEYIVQAGRFCGDDCDEYGDEADEANYLNHNAEMGRAMAHWRGLTDLHDQNVFVMGCGTLAVVDVGCGI